MNKPVTRTDGLRNFVKMALNHLNDGNIEEAKLTLIDLINDIGSAYVCKEKFPKVTNPIPTYNPRTDGNYSQWLVDHNID